MSEKFLNALRHQASLSSVNRIFVTTGVITGYDPTAYLVTVQTDVATDDYPASQTGWIPLASAWVGNSWGLFAPPNIGDICAVYYQDGDSQVPFATLRFFGDTARPLPVSSGEFWIVHQTGSFLKFTNDGKVSLNGNTEIDVTAPILNIIITGDASINAQNCHVTASASCNVVSPEVNLGNGTLNNLINSLFEGTFNVHTHGGGPPPDDPMPSDNITSNTSAS